MAIWSAEIKELERLFESLKVNLPELEKELGRLIKADDENMILLYSRRCLEVIITDLCKFELKRERGTEPLKGIIDKLNKEKKVPSNIIISMDHLNSLSAYGAHPKDFDPEQVKPVLNNLDIIIKWYLKYKDPQAESKHKNINTKDETIFSDNTAVRIQKSYKKLILLISGAVLVTIVVLALFVFNFIEGKGQTDKIEKSIAVLPFFNDSPDEENTHFINGIMDEILNNLQSIKEFRVVSRTSVEQYRGNSKPTIPEIAKRLKVNYIVEGSGQKYGSTFRLRVQLIDAVNDKHIWADSYEREIKNTGEIFKIQSQIAESIASELETSLTPLEKEHFDRPPTASVEAYDAFLKGRYFYENEITSTPEATKWFQEAIKLDSTFALPWTYLSMCFWRISPSTDSPTFKKAKETALKALELDPSSPIALTNIAEILDNEYNFKEAEEKIQLALRIAPDNPYVLRNAGRFYTILGKKEESISYCKKALQNDPNNKTALQYLFDSYYYGGRLSDAKDVTKEFNDLGYILDCRRKHLLLLAEKDLSAIKFNSDYEGDDSCRKIVLAAVAFLSDNADEAEKIIKELLNDGVSYYDIASSYSFGNNTANTMLYLEKSYAAHEKHLTYIKVDPVFRRFGNEPVFRDIINKMNFPE
jgi:adenylate cyclase